MEKLLNAITALVTLVSPEKIQSIATKIQRSDPTHVALILPSLVNTPNAASLISDVIHSWQETKLSHIELALMLFAASNAYTAATKGQSIELVWTGPTTPFVSARRTEQVLLEVIDSAKTKLFFTSFVAYKIESIISALNEACDRGVQIDMLVESSVEHGGSINIDVISKLRQLVPKANLYAWAEKTEEFVDGKVHAKVVVADERVCFITSANLTGYALNRNMEVGVLIREGSIPNTLHRHLELLINTGIVKSSIKNFDH